MSIQNCKISHSKITPDVCPLTQSQLGVYLECINEPYNEKYNIAVLCRLPKNTEKSRFIEAVKYVASKHKAFGVHIETQNSVPSMVYRDTPITVTEVTAQNTDDYAKSFRKPFDMEKSLYRFEYLTASDGDSFIFDVHHLIFDGTSLKTFLKQILDRYSGLEVPDEQITLFDFSAAEQSINSEEEKQALKDFFKEKLGNTDCDSKPVPDVILKPESAENFGFVSFDIENKLKVFEIADFVSKHKITENALFVAAFGYTAAKFNCTNESFFTVAYHGRFDKRLNSTVGMFVQTLPMCCSFDENTTTDNLLKAAYNDYYTLKGNHSISLGELASEYGAKMNLSFVFQSDILSGIETENGTVEIELLDKGTSVTDIEVMLLKTKSGYKINCHYYEWDYTEDFILSFLNTYVNVVCGMLKANTLNEIELVDGEDVKLLDDFNKTENPYDSEKTIVERFREQAKRNQNNTCLVFKNKKYTYREVDEITDRLARYLVSRGVKADSVVAVLIPRSEYILICSLAVLKAGGGYLPMDATYPPERLNLMVNDSGSVMLITTPEFDRLIDENFKGERIMLTDFLNTDCRNVKLPVPKKSDLFCMLYTSGSTGLPKGVIFEHGNSLVTAVWYKTYFKMDDTTRAISYASYGFDAHVGDLYSPVIAGGQIHIIAEEMRLDLFAVRDYVNQNKITHAVMTTQVGRQFAIMGGFDTLRYLSVGGEKLTPFNAPKEFTFSNLYGPTEGSVLCSGYSLECGLNYRDIPIGKPIDNVKAYIVDKDTHRLPIGCAGELWIAGPHVTRGYLNRPEKTKEAYGDNPFCNEKGYERVYRTGDIVRLMGDGKLQFIGRRDGQVKVRGFRIELTEVEEVIRRFDGIKDATVAAFDEASGGKYIAAYIVSDKQIDINALNKFIAAEKPPYMVPAVTMQIDKIPLNQNQKVNKKALPQPKRTAENIVSPENETQQKIFDTVADVIGHKEFGIDTDIFEAGLTSIGTLKLTVALNDVFGIAVNINELKENSTVRKLEKLFCNSEETQVADILPDYPISQTQMGIFVECSSKPDTVTYNIPILFKLGKKVDTEKLVSAIKTVINAHSYVKTTLFSDGNGDIRAKRNVGTEPIINVISCDAVPEKDELVTPFKLLDSPLYRICIYKTENGNYLFMDFHHIIFDGTSEVILLSDIDKAYLGNKIENEKYSGFEVALEEENAISSERYQKAKAYYDSVFAGCEADCLPPKEPEKDLVGATSLKAVCDTDFATVKEFCDKNKFTLNAFFNAVFGFTLSRFGQFEDVIFTTVYNGRNDPRLASSVTMLVKTLPVTVKTGGERTVSDIISDTKQQLLDSMANDIYSFADISNAYGIKADIIFVYQGDSFTFNSLCGEKAEFIDITPDVAKAPITVNVFLKDGKFEIDTEYCRELYSKEFTACFIDCFNTAIKAFTEKENIKDISLLSEKNAEKLKKFNNTKREFKNIPANKPIERFAELTPDKTAVIGCERQYTFGELNRLANRVANALIGYKVKKDNIIAFVLERIPELSVVELGILKSGGAFLGILPSYPDERIDYCLRDAESTIVITTNDIKAEKADLFGENKPYRTLTIEELFENSAQENPNIDIPPDSLAYCIYTSGSTGNPKGVMIEHHNLVNCAQPHDFTYSLFHGEKGGNVGLAMSSVSFDMSIFDNMLLLMNGKTVCIATDKEIHNPSQLADLVIKNKVDTFAATPSFITNYISIPEFRPALANIKTLVAGAEAFPKALYTELKKISPDMHIINGYGPSECTITCSSKELTGTDKITIGGPAANTAFYVLDRFGNILPPFACGELIICGELVGRGYVKLPEKTAASFFTLNGMPAYRSGDTVRLNADGEVEFFGRIDNQVKLRGFRVELDEIEKCITSFEGIKQSKVIVRNNGNEDFLAAFFTADRSIDIQELTAHLKSKLTYYMVPDVIAQLDVMPLTPNGKIDKKALPDIKRAPKNSSRKAPKKSLEEQLCELFKSVLSAEEFYADDNFFEMGGTSLSASKVTMQLMSKGIKVEYQDIFSNPTPELLAEYIESQKYVKAEQENTESEADESYINELLKYNKLEFAAEVEREPLGDVLLTGAVGFLGSHVLKELIDANEGKIICLVRKGDAPTPEIRLKNMLMYYFGETCENEFKDRISVIEADITDSDLNDTLSAVHFDTLINCAACVKHYAADDIIEKINVTGVENLIECVKAKNARMIQISTVSIPGVHTEETYKKQIKMHENELFVIDDMDNKYGISKYHAELKMLDAIKDGMSGKIIRVGNLMGRHSDGEFQINFNTNAFLNALRGFATIGKCPISHSTDPMSFSPVDLTAKAIVLLAGTNDKFTAFNADNRFGFDEMQLIAACNRCGITITPVDDKEYYSDYYRMLGNEKVNSKLSGLVTNDRPDLHMVDTDNLFTANVLYRLGFAWPLIENAYLDRAIYSLMTLDYFEPDEDNEI